MKRILNVIKMHGTTIKKLSQYSQKSLYLNSTLTILLLFTINYPNTTATQLVFWLIYRSKFRFLQRRPWRFQNKTKELLLHIRRLCNLLCREFYGATTEVQIAENYKHFLSCRSCLIFLKKQRPIRVLCACVESRLTIMTKKCSTGISQLVTCINLEWR